MLARIDTILKKADWLRVTLLTLGVLLLAAYFLWGIFRNFGFLLKKATPFPVNFHSATQANYQADPEYMQIPPMDIQLVIDTIWDQNLNVQDLSLQLTQVHDNFLARVETVTTPTGEAVAATGTSPGPTTSPPQTNTPLPPTATPAPPTNTVAVCGSLSASGFSVATGTKKTS